MKLHLITNPYTPSEVELDDKFILCNDVTLPGDFNPHNTRLWVIGNEYGAIGAVWAQCESDALDELVDSGLGDSFLISEEDQANATEEEQEEWERLGNAGEPANLNYAWMGEVDLQPARDLKLIIALAEARGACANNLYR